MAEFCNSMSERMQVLEEAIAAEASHAGSVLSKQRHLHRVK